MILVVDLDGTILHGNSYRFWVTYLLTGRFGHLSRRARVALRLRTAAMLGGRKLLRWPHARVKARLRRLWSAVIAGDAAAADLSALLDRLDGDVRPWFRPLLAEIGRRRVAAVLATAAAGEYAVPFARRLGFPEVLATSSDPSQAIENLGVAKAAAVSDLIRARGWFGAGFTEALKTPDNTLVFVTETEKKDIRKDQADCMGCLSQCLFSSWADSETNSTGRLADPRSFCIQKTLQDIAHGGPTEQNLMFAGHGAYQFKRDPFYSNGFVPTVKQLVDRILTGD